MFKIFGKYFITFLIFAGVMSSLYYLHKDQVDDAYERGKLETISSHNESIIRELEKRLSESNKSWEFANNQKKTIDETNKSLREIANNANQKPTIVYNDCNEFDLDWMRDANAVSDAYRKKHSGSGESELPTSDTFNGTNKTGDKAK